MQPVTVKITGDGDGQPVDHFIKAVDEHKLHPRAEQAGSDSFSRSGLQPHGSLRYGKSRQQRLRGCFTRNTDGFGITVNTIIARVDQQIFADLDVACSGVASVCGTRRYHGPSGRDAGHTARGGNGHAVAVAGKDDRHGRCSVRVIHGIQRYTAALLDGLISAANGNMRQRGRDREIRTRAQAPRTDDKQSMRAA